ncbi:MAG: hypothetical protein KDD11_08995 [Acidobacteria bacterium]|nr:hypothetical protein [Acidobacteriota bacterium]
METPNSYWTATDSQGKYEVETRYCLESVSASAFGYELSDDARPTVYDPTHCSLDPGNYAGPDVVVAKLIPAGLTFPTWPPYEPLVLNPTLLNAPSTRRVACRDANGWVLQP